MVLKLPRPSFLVVGVLTLTILLFITGSAGQEDILKLGSSLSKQLNSSSKAFFLSLRPAPAPSPSSAGLFLAISFAAAPAGPPAWVANRDDQVSSSATLTLLPNGDLSLSDTSISATPLWSSGTAGLGVTHAQLLDTGNFVLVNNASAVVWQSFLLPTDTLLPSQNFTSQSSAVLKSNKGAGSFNSGNYNLSFSTGALRLSSDAQVGGYWSDWGNISSFRFDLVESNITLYSSPSSIISTFIPDTNITSSSIFRLTLDIDGNLRIYTWDTASSEWTSLWMAFYDVCSRVLGLCGEYGVCIYNPQPTCVCPPGFYVRDSSILSSGCERNYTLSGCEQIKYVEMENVDFPFNDYANLSDVLSIDACKQQCTDYCLCVAAVYYQTSDHRCWLKTNATNGKSMVDQKYLVFLKISASDPLVVTPVKDKATNWSSEGLYPFSPYTVTNQTINNTANQTAMVDTGYKASTVIALSTLVGALAFCFVAAIIALVKSRRKLQYTRLRGDLENTAGSPLLFSYQQIEAATEKFSHKLGEGGFGAVYKGKLESGQVVAVKQLEGVAHLERQFRAEIATLGRIHHMNLLRLVGFCSEGSHRLLVYEFMENGSLDQILFQDGDRASQIDALNWPTRFQIGLAVARGLQYLHEECLDCILHCDIKPQNILLDSTYTAKVADFGLAYLYNRDHTLRMTTIRGTRGYLAPEWLSNLPITVKADVYSYGMLLMEIMSGRKNFLYTESAMMEKDEKWCFPMWAYGKKAEEVIDARVDASSVDWEKANCVLRVAFACSQADMKARPSMGRVVQMLEGILPIPNVPPPSLFPDDSPQRNSISSSSRALCSSSKAANTTSSSSSADK